MELCAKWSLADMQIAEKLCDETTPLHHRLPGSDCHGPSRHHGHLRPGSHTERLNSLPNSAIQRRRSSHQSSWHFAL
eukprot:4319177-Amphidinium_carterae.2